MEALCVEVMVEVWERRTRRKREGTKEVGGGSTEVGLGEGKREGEGTTVGEDPCSVCEAVVHLNSWLLRAIDRSVISGRDPQLVEGVVSCVLLLLYTEGVSMETVTDTLCRIVQV